MIRALHQIFILVIIPRTVKLARRVKRGEEKENAYKILMEKPEG